MNLLFLGWRFCFPGSKSPKRQPTKLLIRTRSSPPASMPSLFMIKPSMKSVEAMTTQRSSAGGSRFPFFNPRYRNRLATADEIKMIPAAANGILSFPSFIRAINADAAITSSRAVRSHASSTRTILLPLSLSMLLFIKNPRQSDVVHLIGRGCRSFLDPESFIYAWWQPLPRPPSSPSWKSPTSSPEYGHGLRRSQR